jgi:hypothetical protein
MRKGRNLIVHAILWAWLVMLAAAVWPSAATAVALFAALALWDTARDLKVSRPKARTTVDGRSGALPARGLAPVPDA